MLQEEGVTSTAFPVSQVVVFDELQGVANSVSGEMVLGTVSIVLD